MRRFFQITMLIFLVACAGKRENAAVKVENQEVVLPGEGLIDGEGKMLVVANCTGCHSEKMVTQNRATREGWQSMIRWMQATQNLWPLGENEEKILDYLEANYAPEKKGRRPNLAGVEWYKLEQ